MSATGQGVLCPWCTRAVDLQDPRALHVELGRGPVEVDDDEDGSRWERWLDLSFCTEEHLRTWLERGLPPTDSWESEPATDPTGWAEKVGEAIGCAVLVLVVLLLVAGAGYGAFELVRTLLG